jgi:flagellar basal body-associated protein FliL
MSFKDRLLALLPKRKPGGAAAPASPLTGSQMLRGLLMACAGLSVAICAVGSFVLWKSIPRASHVSTHHDAAEAEEHGDGHGEHAEASGHGEEVDPLGLYQVIPRSIVQRQDGVPEEGHDLVDPEISEGRSIASILKDANKTEELTIVRNRYVMLDEIFASTRAGVQEAANVIAEIGVEVNSLEAQDEVLARKIELRAAVASLISEQDGTLLRTFEGKARLKKQIMDDVNHRIPKGRVTDVLFQSFVIR